jgi:hypothetical protein
MRIKDLLTPAPPCDENKTPPLRERLKWFAFLMAGGVLSVAATAYALRAILLLAS